MSKNSKVCSFSGWGQFLQSFCRSTSEFVSFVSGEAIHTHWWSMDFVRSTSIEMNSDQLEQRFIFTEVTFYKIHILAKMVVQSLNFVSVSFLQSNSKCIFFNCQENIIILPKKTQNPQTKFKVRENVFESLFNM